MRLRTRKSDRKGAATVEFALMAIPFFLFLFGTLEFGRLILARHSLAAAAREGARLAALNTDVNGDDENHLTTADIEAAVQPPLKGQGIRDVRVHIYHVDDPTTDWVAHATSQHRIAVNVQGRYKPMVPLLALVTSGTMSTIPLSAQAIAYSEGH